MASKHNLLIKSLKLKIFSFFPQLSPIQRRHFSVAFNPSQFLKDHIDVIFPLDTQLARNHLRKVHYGISWGKIVESLSIANPFLTLILLSCFCLSNGVSRHNIHFGAVLEEGCGGFQLKGVFSAL